MRSKISRDQAVEYAKAELRLLRDAWWTAHPRPEVASKSEQSVYKWMAQGLAAWSGYNPRQVASPYTLERLDELIEQSLIDCVAFDAVILVAADFEYRRQPMPEPLLGWVQEVQRKRLRRPKMKRGKIPGRYFFRDVAIHQLLQEIVHLGFTATRNDETDHRDSACDIVADALKDIGDPNERIIGADSIKDIWERLKNGGRG
jgi:hypothetical protein